MFGKNWISKPGNFFVRFDCYRGNNEEQNWRSAPQPPLTDFFPYSFRSFFPQSHISPPSSIGSIAIVRNGWSCSSTHFCLFTIICPSILLNKGFPSIQMVILPPEPLSRFWNFESEIVPAIAIMTVQGSWGVGAKMFVRGHDGKDLTPIRPSDWCFRYKLNTHQVYTCIL